MKNLVTSLFIVSTMTAASQSFDAGNIKLSILKDTLTTELDDPMTTLEFSLRNCSNSNVIMYEFNSTIKGDGLGRIDPFCDPENTSAGIILYVFDSTHRPVTAIHWYVNDLKNPMTKKRFDSLILAHKENYLNRAVILKEWQISNFEQKIDLHEFQLRQGRYFIQLLYFSGRRITNFVREGQISNDKRLFNAEVYQGCVVSNRSLLIVD